MASVNTKRETKKAGFDLYNTPKEAIDGLIRQYPGAISGVSTWIDPCSGLNKLVNPLRELGKKVFSVDINNYGHQDFCQDFLKMGPLPDEIEGIIINPPYNKTLEFVDKAVELCNASENCKRIVMFNRLTTLESQSRGLRFAVNDWPLSDVYIMSYRVSCTEGVNEEPTATAVAYAWFVFDMSSPTEELMAPRLHWITKEPE